MKVGENVKKSCAIQDRIRAAIPWTATEPANSGSIPTGDMPDDRIQIGPEHIAKAKVIFPQLLELLLPVLEISPWERAVVAVYGGSGVGKSETASLLSYHLTQMGVGAYTLSGDNYPLRLPRYNDAERLRIFRQNGMRGLMASGRYSVELGETLCQLQRRNLDADRSIQQKHPWLSQYQQYGDLGLKSYLGTQNEIDFQELSGLLSGFKNGENVMYLKRMGREEGSVWYKPVEFGETNVLVLEWTHGNSDNLLGVDIPILLDSTPAETLAHRRSRGRDKGVDSPFTERVLCIEGALLASQKHKAKLIVSKDNRILHSALKDPMQG